MNIMGMGMMELAVVLLVAFLVLGPGRTIDVARRAGRTLGDLRRTFSEVTDAISAEERGRGQGPPSSQSPPPGVPSRPDLPDSDDGAGDDGGTDDGGRASAPGRSGDGRG